LGVRVCPHCTKIVPAGLAVAYSDGLECPHCHTRLIVTTGSRMGAIWIALGAAWLVWYVTRQSTGDSIDTLAWVLPELYAVLTFGVVAPLVMMFTARFVIAPEIPVIDAEAPSSHTVAGHDAGHGGHH
jgi:hypothetical protein